jgi:superfamily II DNA/RNA helicase
MKNKEDVCSTAYIHRVGRTGRYSDEGIALTFVSSNIFIKLAEEEQKIKFQEMKSEADIIRLTVECTLKNTKDTEENSKHRF